MDKVIRGDELALLFHAAHAVLPFVPHLGHYVGGPAPRAVGVLAVEGEGAQGGVVVKADGAEEVFDGFGGLEGFGDGVGGGGRGGAGSGRS